MAAITIHVTAAPMAPAECQELARAVADLVLLTLAATASATTTAPASDPDASQEAA